MGKISLFLVSLISFLGVVVGFILNKLAKEEIKFGKFGARYFVWMKRIILIALIIIAAYFTKNIALVLSFFIIGFILSIFLSEYFSLSFAMLLGFLNGNKLLILIASLVFLYGLPYGSMLRRIKKEHFLILLFFFLPLLLIFININQDILIGLIAGGCLNCIIRR